MKIKQCSHVRSTYIYIHVCTITCLSDLAITLERRLSVLGEISGYDMPPHSDDSSLCRFGHPFEAIPLSCNTIYDFVVIQS